MPPSPKTITAANKQKNYKLMKAATLLYFRKAEFNHENHELFIEFEVNIFVAYCPRGG